MPKITKRTVDLLRADKTGRDVFVWDAGDGALKGFGVRVKPSGSATYLVQYRNREGRTRRLALAKVGTVTPDEAREMARGRLAEAAKGADPSAERRVARDAITVGELCDLYLSHAKGKIKDSTLAMDRSRIDTHVRPLIGRLSVRSLTGADIERMKSDILAGKTAKPRKPGRGGVSKGGPGVTARTVGMLRTILEYARGSLRIIVENPANGVKKPTDGKQRRFLNLDEIARLGEALRLSEDNRESPTATAAIRLLILTGFRRMEALSLPRAWIDARARCIRFEDTKSGYQLRALGSQALKLLQSQPHDGRSPWVFPADRGSGHFIGLPKVLERVCEKAGLNGITLHVLRHSFAAAAAEMGFSELTIAGLLGHSVPGVTARYAHIPDSALVAAAERVSSRIAAALEGNASANVVDLADVRSSA